MPATPRTRQDRLLLGARLGHVEALDVAGFVLVDDHEVEDPDRPGILELLQWPG